MKSLTRNLVMLGVFSGLVFGCTEEDRKQPPGARIESDSRTEISSSGKEKFSQIEKAVAELEPTEGNTASGRVTFAPYPSGDAMKVEVDMSGLQPGEHGFHIHSQPDCSDSASNAGGHLDPQGVKHGAPDAETHHAGDMGNITADSDGDVGTTLKLEELAFSGPNNILNRPVIVHERRDDLTSQPSGDAGARVACGIIRAQRDQIADNPEK